MHHRVGEIDLFPLTHIPSLSLSFLPYHLYTFSNIIGEIGWGEMRRVPPSK